MKTTISRSATPQPRRQGLRVDSAATPRARRQSLPELTIEDLRHVAGGPSGQNWRPFTALS